MGSFIKMAYQIDQKGFSISGAIMPPGGSNEIGWLSAIYQLQFDKLPDLIDKRLPVNIIFPQTQQVSGTVNANVNFPQTQRISAEILPLPTNAASQGTLEQLRDRLPNTLSNGRFRVERIGTYSIIDPTLTDGQTFPTRCDQKGNQRVSIHDTILQASGSLFIEQADLTKFLQVRAFCGNDQDEIVNAFSGSLTTNEWVRIGSYKDYQNYNLIAITPIVITASDNTVATCDIRFKWSSDGSDSIFFYDTTQGNGTASGGIQIKTNNINVWQFSPSSTGVKSGNPIILPRQKRFLVPEARLSTTSVAICQIQLSAVGITRT